MVSNKDVGQFIFSLNPEVFGVKSITSVEISDLPKGMWNWNFLVKINDLRFVLKAYLENKEGFISNSGRKEFLALKSVEDIGIAPRPVLFDNSKGIINGEVLIYTYIEGEPIQKFTKDNLSRLAKSLSLIHNKHKISGDGEIEKTNETLEGLNELANSMINSYKDKVGNENLNYLFFRGVLDNLSKESSKSSEHPHGLVHGDLVPGNLIENPSGVYIIDWQTPKMCDPAFDVWALTNEAYNRWDLDSHVTEEEKEHFIQEYILHTGDDDVIRRIKEKEPYWILVLSIYSLDRYYEYMAGNKFPEREEKFAKYLKAIDYSIHYFENKLGLRYSGQ